MATRAARTSVIRCVPLRAFDRITISEHEFRYVSKIAAVGALIPVAWELLRHLVGGKRIPPRINVAA